MIVVKKNTQSKLVDRKQRLVNARGYLVDPHGNVIDFRGGKVFDKSVLDKDGEIPAVFKGNMLKQDTGSSLSKLMSEIERYVPTIENDLPNNAKPKDVDTSLDSQMEDTPANYNQAN